MYGQIDAPREWFMEATRRLIKRAFQSSSFRPMFLYGFWNSEQTRWISSFTC